MQNTSVRIGVALIAIAVICAIAWFLHARFIATLPNSPTPIATTTPDTTKRLTLHKSGKYYDISAEYPAQTGLPGEKNAAAVALMKAYLDAQATAFIDDNKLEKLTPEDIKIQGLDEEDRSYALKITYETHASPHTVSYVYTVYSDTLGAHPNAYFRTFTFDTTSGASLDLKDLFENGAKYLGTISDMARAKLPAIIAAKENVPTSEVDRDSITPGITPEPETFQNFYLENGTLTIIFPPYQVGPWALGTVLLPISTNDLPSLKAEYK